MEDRDRAGSPSPGSEQPVLPGLEPPRLPPTAGEPPVPEPSPQVPDASAAVPDASAAVPDASAAVPDASAAVPETSTAVPDASAAVPESTRVADLAPVSEGPAETAPATDRPVAVTERVEDPRPDQLPTEPAPTPERTRRGAGPLLVAVATLVVLAAGGATAFLLLRHRPAPIPPPSTVSTPYLAAWTHRDWRAMAALVELPPADFATTNAAALSDVGAAVATFTAGPVSRTRGAATVAVSARLTLTGLGTWDYQTSLPLVVVKRHWLVRWSTTVINPQLGPGMHLSRTRTLPPRAPVLAEDGRPLDTVSGAGELVGGVAPASAATAARLGPLYLPGDELGTSGLEASQNTQLSGEPTGDVLLLDASDRAVATLHHFPGVPAQAVTTTIDPNMQALADRVLAPVSQPAAFVAIDTNTFDVRAIVSHPDGGYPRALVGTYPAGSTFKVITATAALEAGFTPSTPIACPPSIDVDGRSFTNAEHEQLGTIPFQQAFARSCNTAFIGTAEKLTDAQLDAAAATYGINADWAFPVPHFTGRLPPAISPVEHVADAIGQGRVAVSPLEMATVATAVAHGSWEPPHLITTTPPGTQTSLPSTVVTDLRLFMRSVVTSGTGTAANLPGDPVFAKTGTAEFGSGNPPRTHAWFIGWRDNTAFAVIVEGGGFGGDVAAPLAARFLSGL